MEYFICEHHDECLKRECLMLIPRIVQKPVTNCDSYGCNVIDMIIDADTARKMLVEMYPELLTIGHT